MRDEEIKQYSGRNVTIEEKWNVSPRNRFHWYNASTRFALDYLGAGNGRSCLVIGSPVFEVISLIKNGWDTTYLDIRTPPEAAGKHMICDATEITADDESFDAVSSSCVLTHAGTGRYGDGTDRSEYGDEMMLGEIHRVLRRGALAALTFGACADMPRMVRLGALHRIYTVQECLRMLKAAFLDVLEMRIWSYKTRDWLKEGEKITTDYMAPDYISFAVRK